MTQLLDQRRPRRVDAARNFDAIIDAARVAYTTDGVDVSLEEIARRAGVGIATLYRNFGRREDLVEAVYLAEVDDVCRFTDRVATLEPWPALRAWADRFVAYLNTKHALVTVLNRDSAAFRTCRDALYATAAPLLAAAVDDGSVHPDVTLDDLMRMLFALTAGSYLDDAQRGRVLDIALRGTATAPRQLTSTKPRERPSRRTQRD